MTETLRRLCVASMYRAHEASKTNPCDGYDVPKMEITMLNNLRWWLFVQLSHVGWKLCPEPQRSRLHRGIGTWDDIEARIKDTSRD